MTGGPSEGCRRSGREWLLGRAALEVRERERERGERKREKQREGEIYRERMQDD